jgi:hypothetical protein
MAHAMLGSTWASPPKTCKRWRGPCDRAPQPRGMSVRRDSSRCNRCGRPASTPSTSLLPRGCAALNRGGVWEARWLFRPTVDVDVGSRGPKGHERRMHGPRHAGVRIVPQGPTLMLALDAHRHQEGPCTVGDLGPYGHARVPESEQQAVERGKSMRQARSRKKRSVLRADLEERYCKAL